VRDRRIIAVFILASRNERQYVEEFWMHLAMARRQMVGVSWIYPLYVEDILTESALVALLPSRYVVIACLSNALLSAILDAPALREMIDGAVGKFPFIISPCGWDEYPSPFAGLSPACDKAITEVVRKDALFMQAVQRVKQEIVRLQGEL
jgi:hypothetical protein